MYCKNCGKQIDNNAVVCVHCGVSTDSQAATYCRNCGKPINPNAAICTSCGAATGNTSAVKSGGNKDVSIGFVVMSVLLFIFGIIYGALNMNDGNKRTGGVYLWCGISAGILWVIFAIIMIASH